MEHTNQNSVLTELNGNSIREPRPPSLLTPPVKSKYNLRERKPRPAKRVTRSASTRAKRRQTTDDEKAPENRSPHPADPLLSALPTTYDSDTVTELLETSEEEEKDENTYPTTPQPPNPERYPTLMSFVLRDTFRKRYGAGWEVMYEDPSTRQALRAELRNHLADEINHSVLGFETTPPKPGHDRIPCQCYLHKYFGADRRLTFPDCRTQPCHDGQYQGPDSPTSEPDGHH